MGRPYSYGAKSMARLMGCDRRLQMVMFEAIRHMDISILEGHRTEERQNALFAEGKSKLRYPDSKHNSEPSKAIDCVPFPVNWEDKAQFAYMAGMIRMIGSEMGFNIRWGGDWDSDGIAITDQNFDDLPHFELVDD